MQQAFSNMEKEMADAMGIAMYQRFSIAEAALFLRCPVDELQQLQRKGKIEYIQVAKNHTDFFGFQLIKYLCTSIKSANTNVSVINDAPDKILNVSQVIEITGLSRSTIWRLENKGNFPRRVSLSTCRIGWRSLEVEQWLKTR